MTVIEDILSIWGLISLIWIIAIFLNKRLYNNQIKLKSVIEKMRDRSPNEKNSGERIQILDIPMQQYDLRNLENRYTISDVEDYISELERLKKLKIHKRYSVDNLILKLYTLKNSLKKNDTFQIKMDCLVLSKVVFDKRYDVSRFRKFSNHF